jgi:uncharacterized membrane protein
MNKNRLEAFSDGVIAIIITIMVLELRMPENANWSSLQPLIPVLLSYVLSFIYVGIYWNNHHHLLHVTKHVSAGIMWANLNLLFWLSLVPAATGWMGKNNFAQNTVIVYAILLLICGASYSILQRTIVNCHEMNDKLRNVLKRTQVKASFSIITYLVAIPVSFIHSYISGIFIAAVAIAWIVPDKNIEKAIKE